jgi:hypothetical protein
MLWVFGFVELVDFGEGLDKFKNEGFLCFL